jgi:alkaline phosphatase D
MRHFTYIIALSFLFLSAYSQATKIQSGPMLGYAECQEAVVWLQLKNAGRVYARYGKKEDESLNLETKMVATSANTGNTAKLYFTNLAEGTEYRYQLIVDGEAQSFEYLLSFTTAPLWEYRTDPPAFTMAMGSCTYINEAATDRPGRPYGGQYEIFESIYQTQPDAMLWLGDNIYLRPTDWWTRSGYLNRYTHTRSLPQLQPLLASCNHFAIWDDHDFGPNDASGSWVQKDLALETFKLFWVNHTFGYRDLPGTMSAFRYRDVDFILMDNRYHRTEESATHPEHIFGKKQCDRLIDLLKQSRAPFKVVATGGQFLNSAKVYENHSNFEQERQYLLDRLDQENIKGVVFISGDRHHSEVMEYKLPGGNKVFEFTVSPLTSGPNTTVEEYNEHRVKGSLLTVRNFGLLNVSGPFRNRVLNFSFKNTQGKTLFTHILHEKDLH